MTQIKAVFAVEDKDGIQKTLPVTDFDTFPGETPHIEIRLAPGNLITEIFLSDHNWTGQTYLKLRDRASPKRCVSSVQSMQSCGSTR